MASYGDSVLRGYSQFLKGNEDFPSKSNFFDSLWIIHETNKITAGLDVRIIMSASLYHYIRSFINLRQGENEPKILSNYVLIMSMRPRS